MSTFVVDRTAPHAEPALIEPGTRLADILDVLAARMTPEQRGAFFSQMVAMDRHGPLSAATSTLGRA